MSNAKRGLKALGLSLVAAMGLMAFMAGGAQAVTWDIAGKEIAANATASGNLVAGQEALLLVPAQNLAIHCQSAHVIELIVLTSNTLHLVVVHLKCKTLVKGVESPGCVPEILPIKSTISSVLHNGEIYLLAIGREAGGVFTTIHYNEETCALPPLPTVKGSVAFECYKGALILDDCKTAKVKHLIRPVPNQALLGDELLYGLNSATMHGEAEIFLTGANEGKTFNALV